jgi:hypothetical protein
VDWAILGLGAFGGLVNGLWVDSLVFYWPARHKGDQGRSGWHLGTLGMALIGAAAAFGGVHVLDLSKLGTGQQWGLAVILGFGGGSVLEQLLSRTNTVAKDRNLTSLAAAYRDLAQRDVTKPPSSPSGNGTP